MKSTVPDATSARSGRLQINRLATSARMVAGLAHELNNSLQVVSGLVELLGDRTDLPADARGAHPEDRRPDRQGLGSASARCVAYTREWARRPER